MAAFLGVCVGAERGSRAWIGLIARLVLEPHPPLAPFSFILKAIPDEVQLTLTINPPGPPGNFYVFERQHAETP